MERQFYTQPAKLVPGPPLSVQEAAFYENLFNLANPQSLPRVGGKSLAHFFKKSKLSTRTLRQLWTMMPACPENSMDRDGFFTFLKLIALAQSGQDPSLEHLSSATPLPKFCGLEGQELLAISAEEFQDCEAAFLQQTEGLSIESVRARIILLRTQVSTRKLKAIWALVDPHKQSKISKQQFIVAIHLANKVKHLDLEVPEELPDCLYSVIQVSEEDHRMSSELQRMIDADQQEYEQLVARNSEILELISVLESSLVSKQDLVLSKEKMLNENRVLEQTYSDLQDRTTFEINAMESAVQVLNAAHTEEMQKLAEEIEDYRAELKQINQIRGEMTRNIKLYESQHQQAMEAYNSVKKEYKQNKKNEKLLKNELQKLTQEDSKAAQEEPNRFSKFFTGFDEIGVKDDEFNFGFAFKPEDLQAENQELTERLDLFGGQQEGFCFEFQEDGLGRGDVCFEDLQFVDMKQSME